MGGSGGRVTWDIRVGKRVNDLDAMYSLYVSGHHCGGGWHVKINSTKPDADGILTMDPRQNGWNVWHDPENHHIVLYADAYVLYISGHYEFGWYVKAQWHDKLATILFAHPTDEATRQRALDAYFRSLEEH